MNEPSYSIKYLGLRAHGSMEQAAAYVATRSSLKPEEVAARLARPPVLLLKQAPRVTALRGLQRLVACGARLSVTSKLSGVTLEEIPSSGSEQFDEALKLWLTDGLDSRETLCCTAFASSRLRLPEYASAGGMPSYLARSVLLVATDRRLLTIGLKTPSGAPAEWLQAMDYRAIRSASGKDGGLVVKGQREKQLSFHGLKAEAAARILELVETASRDPDPDLDLGQPLCRVCGLRSQCSSPVACDRCGAGLRDPKRSALQALVAPGWSLAAQRRSAAAASIWVGSALLALGLALWFRRAEAAALGRWSWAYPATVWLAWCGSHALAEWTRIRDEVGMPLSRRLSGADKKL